MIDTDIIEIRDSFKRTADIAELDEDEEGGQRLGKTRRQGQCAGLSPGERV